LAAVLGAFRTALCALLVAGCVSSPYQPFDGNDGLLRHPLHPVAVPDLTAQGWEPVEFDEADLAFRKRGSGMIAVRSRCGSGSRPLVWETRDLWLGIPRQDLVSRELRVHGFPARETRAESQGLRVRTLSVQAERCTLDIAHVALPLAADGSDASLDAVLDAFVEATRLVGEAGP